MPKFLRYIYNLIFHFTWSDCPHSHVYLGRHYFVRCCACGALMSDGCKKPEGKPRINFDQEEDRRREAKYGKRFAD